MNTASEDDGIPVELSQILKDDAVKVLYSICQQIWKTQQLSQEWKKVSVHSNPTERQCQRMLKLLHNCAHLTCQQRNAQNSPSQASTVHELWTSRCSSWIYKRHRNQRSNCHQPLDHQKSKRVPEKHLLLLFWLHQSLWLWLWLWLWLSDLVVWITTNCGKFLKRWECQTTWPASWEICMQVKKQQLALEMEKQTGYISGMEYIKADYCHPAYLTYM